MSLITSSEWDSLIHTSAKMSVVVRAYFGDETDGVDFVALTNQPGIVIDGKPYAPLILNFPSIKSAINIKTFAHTLSGDKIVLDNTNLDGVGQAPGSRITDEIATRTSGAGDVGFYNRKIEIRLHLEGITTWANCFAIMGEGKVRDIKHDRMKSTFTFRDNSDQSYRDAGELMAASDAADGIALPNSSLGTIKPIVIGDHRGYYGHFDGLVDTEADANATTALQYNMFVPSRYLGLDTSGRHRWWVADKTQFAVDKLWAMHPNINRTVQLPSFVVEQNTSSGCIISHADDPDWYDFYYSIGVVSNEANVQPGSVDADWKNGSGGGGDGSYAGDKDVDSFAQSEIESGFGVTAKAEIDLDFAAYVSPIPDGSISQVRLFAKAIYSRGSGITDAQVDFVVTTTGGSTDLATAINPDSLSVVTANTETADKNGVGTKPTMSHSRQLTGSNTETTAKIYELWKRITFKDSERLLNIVSGGQGDEYDTWINGREAAVDTDPRLDPDLYAETHQDHDGSATLIESFAGVVELLMRNVMSMGNTTIDTGAMNIASQRLPTAIWKCATSIIELTPMRTLLVDISRNCRSWIWWQPDGYAKMQVIEDTYSSSTRAISAKQFKGLKFTRTQVSNLKTAVKILYSYSPLTNAFTRIEAVSEDTAAQTYYNVSQGETLLDFEAKFINNSTTAAALQTFWLNWLKNLHNLASGELPRQHLDLDIGDIIEITDMQYLVFGEDITDNAVTRAGQTIYKYWKIYEIDRGATAKVKLIQMHKLD